MLGFHVETAMAHAQFLIHGHLAHLRALRAMEGQTQAEALQFAGGVPVLVNGVQGQGVVQVEGFPQQPRPLSAPGLHRGRQGFPFVEVHHRLHAEEGPQAAREDHAKEAGVEQGRSRQAQAAPGPDGHGSRCPLRGPREFMPEGRIPEVGFGRNQVPLGAQTADLLHHHDGQGHGGQAQGGQEGRAGEDMVQSQPVHQGRDRGPVVPKAGPPPRPWPPPSGAGLPPARPAPR